MAILRSLRSTMVSLIGITLMALPVVSASNSTNATGGIVPLSPKVGTGLLPTHLEGGLVESVGNRFTNALYAPLSNITDGNVGWSSCWGCVLTIAEELPCVFAAIAAENPALLLDCGVTFSNICDCLSCLPDAVQPFVQTFCGNSAYKSTTPTRALANATYSDSTDYNVDAFLGKMDAAEVAYVQKQNAASCVIGKECGGVCCIGGCVDYLCVGQPTFCDVQPYGQCGGQGWVGCTACVNSTCEVQSAFYSECLPLA